MEEKMLRLEELRKQLGLSQNELAEKLNMTQQRISAYEKGKREPDINTITQLADFFGVSTDYLLGKSNIRKTDAEIKKEFDFAYHKDAEGLTDEEIADAIRFYKQIKYGKKDT
jgi:transcriptional regulator with XRE-family HTH domain